MGIDLARTARALRLGGLLAACGFAAACSSSNSGAGLSGSVGTGTGITISTSTGSVVVQEGATITLTATVASDTTNAGVTWSLSGVGTLSGATTTQVTYTAPPVGTITGVSTPVITATSIADTTQSATASLVVDGAPVIDPITLFPANVNSLWGANVTVVGGLAPFTWTQSAGTLPPGLALNASTSSTVTITGTPTTTGTYTFQLQATDADSRSATVDLTLVINPQAACLLNGRFAFLYTGFDGQRAETRAASLAVGSDGSITGVMDTRSATGATLAESITGTCATRTANNGTLTLNGSSSGQLIFDYAIRAGLDKGRVQLSNGGNDAAGSGLFELQDSTAFAALPPDTAFGLVGADSNDASMGLAGYMHNDGAGNLSGVADANGTPSLDAAALSGTMAAADPTTGRGTLTLTIGGRSYPLVYYVVNANRLLAVDMETGTSAQRLAGFITTRTGPFDATSLASPGILSLWGAGTGSEPVAVVALGRLANANTAAHTLDLTLDTSDQSTQTADVQITGASYGVDANGRSTLSFTASGTPRSLVLYLDGLANGYVVEKNSTTGNAGLLEAQAAGPYSGTLPGLFLYGTQYPRSLGPIAMLPIVNFSSGVMSASYGNAYYSLDSTTGRGVGTLSLSGIGSSAMSMYVVRPDRVVLLQYGFSTRGGTINWVDK